MSKFLTLRPKISIWRFTNTSIIVIYLPITELSVPPNAQIQCAQSGTWNREKLHFELKYFGKIEDGSLKNEKNNLITISIYIIFRQHVATVFCKDDLIEKGKKVVLLKSMHRFLLGNKGKHLKCYV